MKIDAQRRNELLNRLDEWYEKSTGNDEKSKFDEVVFKKLYSQLLSENAYIDWKKWSFIKEKVQRNLDELPPFNSSKKTFLDRLVVVRLNGGLGTSMGCQGPKSFIGVKDGFSFLDLAFKQVKSEIPLLLMDSFNTFTETTERLAGRAVRQFEQSRCPRIYSDTLLPVEEESERWYPPGHGNIFASLAFSGELDRLLAEGRDIIFVSNIDNTGAVIEPAIAQFFVDADAEYAMECTLKTQADIKGGTLIEIDNHIMHLEIPQVPPQHLDDFCSTRVFKIFNTNNIWVNLRAVKRRLEEIRSEIIVNKKKLSNGREVIQLETSIGGSIRAFERAYCIHVPRARFLPVKKTDDLLTISSDLYKLQEDFSLKLSRSTPAPFVSLSSHFQEVDNFQKRFKNFPKMDDLRSLIVEGDVWFEEEVTLIGDVKIRAKNGERLVIDKRITLTDCEYSGE
ncbi:unnamed protein product, partial [Mesorhabditis belari]|uniref:UTP--glucose-1-phosphate uridylyltransferase n=1 Tax=Mesorhabditis belari TaxID=2138241 RepID=A0AAF3FK31_9BILA